MFSNVLRIFSGCSEMFSGVPRIFAKMQVGRSIQSGGFAYNAILFDKRNAFSDVLGCSQIFSGCSQMFSNVPRYLQRCKLEGQYNLVELNGSNPSLCIQSNPIWWSQCNVMILNNLVVLIITIQFYFPKLDIYLKI